MHCSFSFAKKYGVDFAVVRDREKSPPVYTVFFKAKDTSKKIKAVFKAKMRDGKRVSGAVPYGYYRNADLSGN